MPLNPINGTPDNDTIQGTEAGDLIHGLEGNDFIYGDLGADIIHGDEGNDYIDGNGGNDRIYGGTGDDELSGGSYYGGGDGEDWLFGGAGNDIIHSDTYAAQNYDHVFGGAGDDFIDMVLSLYRPLGGEIHGGGGVDTLKIISSDPTFSTPPDFDVHFAISGPNEGGSYRGGSMTISGIDILDIQTGLGDDTITGGALNDIIDVRGGANNVNGGAGDDFITYRYGEANTIEGGADDDTLELKQPIHNNILGGIVLDATGVIVSESFGSTITGIENFIVNATNAVDDVRFGAGADVFIGLKGNDYAEGNDGDDELNGGEGADRLFGGGGNDRISGGDRFRPDGRDYIDGGDGDDFIQGGYGSDRIFGGAGDDIIFGGFQSIGTSSYLLDGELIRGGSGDDFIREEITGGAVQNARIYGESGNDLIYLSGGAESFIHGGSGIDTLEFRDTGVSYQDQTAVVFSINRAGLPTTITSAGYTLTSMERLILTTGNGDDDIDGGDRDDVLNVGRGDNIVDGFGGSDTIRIDTGNVTFGSTNLIDGGDGYDVLQVVHSGNIGLNVTVSGSIGTDSYGGSFIGIEAYEITGSDGDDNVQLGGERDRFFGGAGDDTGFGEDGNDVLIGHFGDDVLNGGNGRDAIVGGRGFDILTGGADADKFRFGILDDIADHILDFETGIDWFQFRAERLGLDDPGTPTVITSDYFAVGAATASHGQFVFTTDGTDGQLFWDADGVGSGGLTDIAVLFGVSDMDYSDIVLL